MRARGSLRALICENWGVGAGVGYEDISGERLQNGSGGEASGPSPTPTDSTNMTFFKRDIVEWGGLGSIKDTPTGGNLDGVVGGPTIRP
jgi:hypothetical protein